MDRYRQPDFTRIDLAISAAIISVLASIAVPSYASYVLESRRADGIAELSRVMQREQILFEKQGEYSTSMQTLGFTTTRNQLPSEEGHYLVEAMACPDHTIKSCIRLVAHPQGSQETDGWLSLNSLGEKDWENNNTNVFGWP